MMHHWSKIRLCPFSVRRGVFKLTFPEHPKPGWPRLQPEPVLAAKRSVLWSPLCSLCGASVSLSQSSLIAEGTDCTLTVSALRFATGSGSI